MQYFRESTSILMGLTSTSRITTIDRMRVYYILACIILVILMASACRTLPEKTSSPPVPTASPSITTTIKTPIPSPQNPNATILSTTSGTITPGNSSSISITLLVGQSLKGTLMLTNGTTANGVELNIQQPDGKIVNLGNQNTDQRQFEFTTTQNGTHYIIMRNPGPGTSVDYTLSYNINSPPSSSVRYDN
jgi:hypothetical protein